VLTKPASCFVDAVEIALGVPAETLAGDYIDLVGECSHDPNVEGYHPSIVNQALIERFGQGMVCIDFLPVDELGDPYSDHPSRYLATWFKRPGFRCVVTGLRPSGEAHALAYRDGAFIDPATGLQLDQPNIGLKMLWCLSVPPYEPAKDADYV
jgi:hypothetical protein